MQEADETVQLVGNGQAVGLSACAGSGELAGRIENGSFADNCVDDINIGSGMDFPYSICGSGSGFGFYAGIVTDSV